MLRRTRAVERVVLILAIAIGPLLWLGGLGLYHDDWPFVVNMRLSADQSIAGLYAAQSGPANVAVRPLQILLFVLYHKLAPDSPFAAHLINQFMFLGAVLTFHSALRALPVFRRDAFFIALVFACLPHYFTARLWYANHQSILSLLLFMAALWLSVTLRRPVLRWRGLWFAVLFLCAIAGMLAYELFSFLLMAAPLALAMADGRRLRDLPRDWTALLSTALVVAAFVGTTIFKLSVASKLVPPTDAIAFLGKAVRLYVDLAFTDFWTLGLYMPVTAVRLARGPYFHWSALWGAVALLAILLTVMALWGNSNDKTGDEDDRASRPGILILFGAGGFLLGLMPFLANFYYGDSPFGIDNRCNIAASIGIAFLVVGLARLCWMRISPIAGQFVIVGTCFTGVLLQIAVAQMWGDGWQVQERLYARLRAAIPSPPSDSTILIYGACPYAGPTPIFMTSWGLVDRLHNDTRDRSLSASVILPDAVLRPDALVLNDDGEPLPIAYGRMRIFNARTGAVEPIDSYAAAQRFFARNPVAQAADDCDYSDYGGVSVFRN